MLYFRPALWRTEPLIAFVLTTWKIHTWCWDLRALRKEAWGKGGYGTLRSRDWGVRRDYLLEMLEGKGQPHFTTWEYGWSGICLAAFWQEVCHMVKLLGKSMSSGGQRSFWGHCTQPARMRTFGKEAVQGLLRLSQLLGMVSQQWHSLSRSVIKLCSFFFSRARSNSLWEVFWQLIMSVVLKRIAALREKG